MDVVPAVARRVKDRKATKLLAQAGANVEVELFVDGMKYAVRASLALTGVGSSTFFGGGGPQAFSST